jgi:hypothetical protein
MRSPIRQLRQLSLLTIGGFGKGTKAFAEGKGVASTSGGVAIPAEFTAHEYGIFSCMSRPKLEHVLMVEYLYAAFTLGGPQVDLEYRSEVSQWREIILGIAKEEMGNLVTIQNILRCLGGTLNLDREDYPWNSEFYPFPLCWNL